MNYVAGIVAATVASAIAVMMCAGGKHEKLCCSVCCALIALSALVPLRSLATENTAAEFRNYVASSQYESERRVVAACGEELEMRVAAAVTEKYEGVEVTDVRIEYDDTDIQNITVTDCAVVMSGGDEEATKRFVSELLCCENVDVQITGGDKNGDKEDT